MRICSEGRGRFLSEQDHEGDVQGRERSFQRGCCWEEFRNLALNVSVLFSFQCLLRNENITNGKMIDTHFDYPFSICSEKYLLIDFGAW